MKIALDFDGTVVTCASKQTTLLGAACAALGVKIDLAAAWERKRSGMSSERALVDLGVDSGLAAAIGGLWKSQVESVYWSQLDSLFPDVPGALEAARESGHRLLLVSARSRPDLLRIQLARLGVGRFFEQVVVVTPSSATSAKATALSDWGADWMIGDSEVDGQAAALAGVAFMAVGSGQRSPAFLARWQASESLLAAFHAIHALPPVRPRR